MIGRSLFAGAALLAVAQGASIGFEVCSDSLNDLGIKDIALPDFVVAGEKLSVTVTQEPNRYVDKGRVSVELDVEGVKVAHQTYELCSITDCHLAARSESKSAFDFPVPAHVPAGLKTTLKIIVNDHNGAQLSCVDVSGVSVSKTPESGLRATTADGLSLSENELDFMFERWAHEYGQKYAPHEIVERARKFADNLEAVASHNARGDSTYVLHLNQFAAMSQEEFAKTHFGYNGGENMPKPNKEFYQLDLSTESLDLPDSIDWTEKGAVTPVKNQGSCGSCWAFSTTGALEGAYFLKTGQLVSFSEQELVNCDHVDQGCNGGLMDNADKFIQKNGGLCTEQDYPYKGAAGGRVCKTCEVVHGSAPSNVVDVQHNEASLEAAVAKKPVSVAIEADQIAFQFYKSGVLTGSCGSRLDHGVLVVGYGTLDGQKYFKVKNSWGTSYGLNGYVLIQRGKTVRGGECGILLSASYPEL